MEIISEIKAIPKINKSIFKINLDIRFSKNKTPYKLHFSLWFWEGEVKRMECSGFYFHLEPDGLMLGAGVYCFSKHLLLEYRKSILDERYSLELMDIIRDLNLKGYRIGGEYYKKISRGFDRNHSNSYFLLFDGLHVGMSLGMPDEVFSEKLLDYSYKFYKDMLPLHK